MRAKIPPVLPLLLLTVVSGDRSWAIGYPDTVVGYYDAYYKEVPNPEPTDYRVSDGEWNWHEASDALADGLKPALAKAPWLHLFYGIDRYTVHSRTMREHKFGEDVDKVGDFDFVVKTLIGGKAGDYQLHALIVDGKSRAVVEECTIPFSGREDAASAGARAAGKLSDVPDAIVHFWKTQRAHAPNVAIAPQLRVIAPEAMAPSTSVNVTVNAVDVDGAPLKGARVGLYCTSGSLSTDAATIDSKGQARFRFHAGTLPFLGSVTVKLAYATPNGVHESSVVSATIRIGRRHDEWWELRLRLRQQDLGALDKTGPVEGGSAREATLDLVDRQADLVIWYAQKPAFARVPGIVRTGTPIAIVANGQYRRHLYQSATKTSTKGVSGSIDLIDEAGSLDVPPCKGIFITLRGNKLTISGQRVPCETWIDTFNQGFDSWTDFAPTAVDTEKPYGTAYFDFSASKTVTAGEIRSGRVPIHLHEVLPREDHGVTYTVTRDIDGELRSL